MLARFYVTDFDAAYHAAIFPHATLIIQVRKMLEGLLLHPFNNQPGLKSEIFGAMYYWTASFKYIPSCGALAMIRRCCIMERVSHCCMPYRVCLGLMYRSCHVVSVSFDYYFHSRIHLWLSVAGHKTWAAFDVGQLHITGTTHRNRMFFGEPQYHLYQHIHQHESLPPNGIESRFKFVDNNDVDLDIETM